MRSTLTACLLDLIQAKVKMIIKIIVDRFAINVSAKGGYQDGKVCQWRAG